MAAPLAKHPITLTDKAKDALEEAALAHGLMHFTIRIKNVTREGQNAGFDLVFTDEIGARDQVFRVAGLEFVATPETLDKVRGTTIDHGAKGFTFRR